MSKRAMPSDPDLSLGAPWAANINSRHGLNPCSAAETDSCMSVLRSSPHSTLTLLPNHHIGSDAQLHGFHFSCHAQDPASVLPMGKDMFNMISMYECVDDNESHVMHPHALDILNNIAGHQATLDEYIRQLDANPMQPARFDCIPPQLGGDVAVAFDCVDTREWKEEISDKVGIYHTFTRSCSKDTRRHKVFIVVSGCLSEAAEELHNLWQDAGNELTCDEFLRCEELNWMRCTTQRNHNRVASRISRLFGLRMHHVLDSDDPSHQSQFVLPTTSTYKTDIRRAEIGMATGTRYVDGGCFTDMCVNGILFEMYGTEGFWIFQGPRDFADNYTYGSMFANTDAVTCMPTTTISYHKLFPPPEAHSTVRIYCQDSGHSRHYLFPDERFFNILRELGFNRNDGTLNLMPLVHYERRK